MSGASVELEQKGSVNDLRMSSFPDKLLEFVTSMKSSSLPPVKKIETNESFGNTLSSRLSLQLTAVVIVLVLT